MKTIVNHIKEIGVVISYISMLIVCYLFDWKPFGVFMSYLIEIVILLFVFSILRVKDERKNPKRYKKVQPIENLFIGIIPLVLLQYFMIGWMSNFMNTEQNFLKENLLLTQEVFYAIISFGILYSLKAVQITKHSDRLVVFQDNFIFKVMALTGVNIIGFILVIGIGIESFLLVLTVMVAIRIILEIYFGRKMKLI